MNTSRKILIVGGVACGMKTAARLRRREPDADITVIEKNEYLSSAACGFPFYIAGMIKDYRNLMDTPLGVVRDPAFFNSVKGIKALTRAEAVKIDRNRKTVTVVHLAGEEKAVLSYDKLVLATGAIPIVPPLPGKDLPGVFPLATMHDALAVKEFIEKGSCQKAVIVGGGLIGLEAAEALHARGIQVAIIEKLATLLPALLDTEIALLLKNYLTARGIRIITSDSVQRFESGTSGRLEKVVTEKDALDADLVLLAVGFRPNTALARNAGLAIGATGAIKVNRHLQTSDPDIYAGGDCVENPHRITGKDIFAPMGSTANKHGRIIADNIAGDQESFPGVLGTAVCKIFDYSVGRTGLSEKEALEQNYSVETALVPGPDKPHFYKDARMLIIKLIAEKKTGRLLGAQMMGPGDVAKRLEIAVSSLSFGATADQIANLDLAYAPPFSPAMDNMITAANVLRNKLAGTARGISPLAVKEKFDRHDDFIFLDVRSPGEFEQEHIEHPAVKLLPLGRLRGEAEKLPPDKEIIISCKTSLRAYEAQRILEARGFRNVRFMDGGVTAWPFELKRQ